MRTIFFIAAALVLAGCDRAAEKAEDDFHFLLKNNGSNAEKCEAASRARDEWADRKDAEKYDDWQITAKVYC